MKNKPVIVSNFDENAHLGISVVSKRTLILIRVFAVIKNLRTFVLAVYYDIQRSKYSSIMTSQFINGNSLSGEYYKFKRLKRKDEYWSKKVEEIVDYYDSRYVC